MYYAKSDLQRRPIIFETVRIGRKFRIEHRHEVHAVFFVDYWPTRLRCPAIHLKMLPTKKYAAGDFNVYIALIVTKL